jgi:hypothetical protein
MAVSDIFIGPVRIFKGTYGSAEPAVTVASGGNWPAGWTEIMLSKNPVSVEYAYEVVDFETQQHLAPVGRAKKSEKFSVETVLSELTGTNLGTAMGIASVTTVAAVAGVPGYEHFSVGDTNVINVFSWGFEGDTTTGYPMRLFVWRASVAAGVKLEFGKDDYTGVPLRVEALADTTKAKGERLFKLQKITAAAL